MADQRFDKLPCSSIFSTDRKENQELMYQVLVFTGTLLHFQMIPYEDGHKIRANKWVAKIKGKVKGGLVNINLFNNDSLHLISLYQSEATVDFVFRIRNNTWMPNIA